MKNLLTLIFGAVALVNTHAATINWGVDGNFDFVMEDAAGSLLAQGSLAQIGKFNLTDAQIIALASPTPGNIAALNAAFEPFGNARMGDGGFNNDGAFAKTSSQPISPTLLNSQVYYWVLKSTNDTSVSSSVTTAFQQAIFYRDKVTDADWTFPSDIATPPTIDAGDFRGLGGSISAGSVVLAGSYITNSIPGAIYNGGPTSAIQLQAVGPAVPEPSTFVFGLLAGVGALCRRHRRS